MRGYVGGGEISRAAAYGVAAMSATLLLIEDDAIVREFLADNLTADGYSVLVGRHARRRAAAARVQAARSRARGRRAAGRLGLDLITRVRAADRVATRLDPSLPLLIISGRAGELDRLRGFDRGCDDFVSKPFSYGELRRRIEALLRRTGERRGPGPAARRRAGDRPAEPRGPRPRRRVSLSQKEFALLLALAAEPTRVFTKEELLRDVWGFRSMGTTRTLDSHACRLRHKLGAAGDRFVVNVWGVGYRLVDGPVAEAVAA